MTERSKFVGWFHQFLILTAPAKNQQITRSDGTELNKQKCKYRSWSVSYKIFTYFNWFLHCMYLNSLVMTGSALFTNTWNMECPYSILFMTVYVTIVPVSVPISRPTQDEWNVNSCYLSFIMMTRQSGWNSEDVEVALTNISQGTAYEQVSVMTNHTDDVVAIYLRQYSRNNIIPYLVCRLLMTSAYRMWCWGSCSHLCIGCLHSDAHKENRYLCVLWTYSQLIHQYLIIVSRANTPSMTSNELQFWSCLTSGKFNIN